MATDGQQVIGKGERLALWDLASGRLATMISRADQIVTFSKGSASSRSDPLGRPQAFPNLSGPIAFSPGGKRVVFLAGSDLAIATVPEGRPRRRFSSTVWLGPSTRQSFPIRAFALGPDGRTLVYGDSEGRLSVGAVEGVPEATKLPPLRFKKPDGTEEFVEMGYEGHPSAAWKAHDGPILALAIAPDGRTAASGGEDGIVKLWELSSGQELAGWEAHTAAVTALKFHPDGQTLLSGAADGIVTLWDVPAIRNGLDGL